jgi:hypothetical protein
MINPGSSSNLGTIFMMAKEKALEQPAAWIEEPVGFCDLNDDQSDGYQGEQIRLTVSIGAVTSSCSPPVFPELI